MFHLLVIKIKISFFPHQTKVQHYIISLPEMAIYNAILQLVALQIFMDRHKNTIQNQKQQQESLSSGQEHRQQIEEQNKIIQNQLKKHNLNFHPQQKHGEIQITGLDEQVEEKQVYPQLQQQNQQQQNRREQTGSSDTKFKNYLMPQPENSKPTKKQSERSKDSSKNNSLLICIQDSQAIPNVYLQPSPKGQKFVTVKIPMYRTNTFMKMQTQIFILDVSRPGALRDYQIQRRYSDFVQLYEELFYNHPGYILAPFPEKGIQSFMKIKFGIGTHEPGERCQMIEKRMSQLERFINFVTHHSQLTNSEQVTNFLTHDPLVYEQGKKRLQKYLNQNRSLQKSSQIKNLIGIGKSLWGTYVKNKEKPKVTQMTLGKNDIQFGVIYQTVKTEREKLVQSYKLCNSLYQAQKSFGQFVDMPTENDALLKVCAKHTSGKQYCKQFADFIEINVLDEFQYNIKRFQQIEKALNYRLQIWECLEQAKRQGNNEKKQKLSRRLELFERNFLSDWENVFVQIEKKSKTIYEDFAKHWKSHKKSMRKIWRPLKSI